MLEALDPATPVVLNDEILPQDRRLKHQYMNGLRLHFPVYIFSYHQGGSLETLHWVFRVDEEEAGNPTQEELLTIQEELRQKVAKRISRAKLRAFKEQFASFTEITPALRRAMFEKAGGYAPTRMDTQANNFQGRMDALLEVRNASLARQCLIEIVYASACTRCWLCHLSAAASFTIC